MEFLPAEGRYWGLETAALEELVREEMGPWHKVLSTGPAGERCVPFACLSTDQYHKAGRGGAGAVMGSKNLKAVVVRGTGAVAVGDARAFLADMLGLQSDASSPPTTPGHGKRAPVPRRAGQRRRRPAHAQLAVGAVRAGAGDRVGRAPERTQEDPRLHPVPLACRQVISSATTSARVPNSRRSGCAAPTAGSETWRPSPPSTAPATSSASTP